MSREHFHLCISCGMTMTGIHSYKIRHTCCECGGFALVDSATDPRRQKPLEMKAKKSHRRVKNR